MKKWISVLMAAVLLVSLFPAALAADSTNAAMMEMEERYSSDRPVHLMENDGKIYIQAADKIFQYDGTNLTEYLTDVHTADAVYMMEEGGEEILKSGLYVETLFFMDGRLYGLNMRDGILYPVDSDNGRAVFNQDQAKQLSWDGLTEEYEDYKYPPQVENLVIAGHHLCMYSITSFGETVLYVFNLDTGERKDRKQENLTGIGSFSENEILLLTRMDWQEARKQGIQEPGTDVKIFNMESGEEKDAFHLDFSGYSIKGLACSAQDGYYYFSAANEIYRLKDGEPELCAYFPGAIEQGYSGAQTILFKNGMAYGITSSGAYVRSTDPENLPTKSVRICGMGENEVAAKAIREMDGIPVICTTDTYFENAQQLAQAIVSGEDKFDIFLLNLSSYSSMNFKKLMEKGYACPLNESKVLTESLNSLYPYIKEKISLDGQFFAYPVEIYLKSISYFPNTFKMLEEEGLKAEVPQTFMELCDFITVWNDEYFEEYSDYIPFTQWPIKNRLYDLGLSMYGSYMAFSGQQMNLDAPLFREMMEAVENVHTDNLELSENASEEEYGEIMQKEPFFSFFDSPQFESPSVTEDKWFSRTIPMTLNEETPFCLGGDMMVLFVNPRSENQEAAVRFIELYAQNQQTEGYYQDQYVQMRPEMNEPIRDTHYKEAIQNQEKVIEKQKEALKTCEPANRQELEDSLKYSQEWLEKYKARGEFRVTSEALENYHKLVENGVIGGGNPFFRSVGDNSMNQLYKRYMDGQISLDQLIKEGQNKLRLMQLEEQ